VAPQHVETKIDDLSSTVEAMLRKPLDLEAQREHLLEDLRVFDREVQRIADELRDERNRLREKRKIIRDRIKPSWLGPLVQTVRSFLERLPDAQYEAFLTQYEISDGQLAAWLEALANGVDLDDTEMVERLRRLELSPALIIEEFGGLRELIAEETGGDDTSEPPVAQLSLDLEPFIHRVNARITNLRINLSRT
jgi:hypothetical protein